MDGIERCPQLRKLWICETSVTNITGLGKLWAKHAWSHAKADSLLQLEELFMYSNDLHSLDWQQLSALKVQSAYALHGL